MTEPLKITNEKNITGSFCLELKHYCFQLIEKRMTRNRYVPALEFIRIESFLAQLSYIQFAVHNSATLPQKPSFFFNTLNHIYRRVCVH